MKNKIVNSVIILFTIGVFVSAWCSFFPGNFNIDAGGMWEQIKIGTFNNMHPALNTIIGYWLVKIWNNPGVLILFQIFLSLFCLFKLLALFDRLKIKLWIKLLVAIPFFALNPIVIIYNFSYLKDVNFAYLLFLISIILINVYLSKKISTGTTIGLIILITFVSIIRHNGLPLLGFVPLSLFLILRTYNKNFMVYENVLLGSVFLYFVVTICLYNIYKVSPYPRYYPWMTRVHELAAVISLKGSISREEEKYLSEILPFKYWREYYFCYARERLVHSGDGWPSEPHIDYTVIEKDYNKFRKISTAVIVNNFSLVLSQKTCIFSGMLGLGGGLNGNYLYPLASEIELSKQFLDKNLELKKRPVFFSSEKLKSFWLNYFSFLVRRLKFFFVVPFWNFLVWSSWLIFLHLIKKEKKKFRLMVISIMLPTFVTLGTLFVFGPNRDLHFLYFLYLQSLLTPVIFSLYKNGS